MKRSRQEIRKELEKHADADYRKFSSGLLPGITSILGVRLPQLRKMAKELAREDGRWNLKQLSDNCLEELMLQGMIIAYMNCPMEERLDLIQGFVPKINSWSVCDSFCSTLKFVKKDQEPVFLFLQPYIHSDKEYEQRFAAVMLLDYYIDDYWLSKTVEALEEMQADKYYAKMAIAWAMAECYLHFPKEMMPVIRNNSLDPTIQRMTLQKIIESRAIPEEVREEFRTMRNRLNIDIKEKGQHGRDAGNIRRGAETGDPKALSWKKKSRGKRSLY